MGWYKRSKNGIGQIRNSEFGEQNLGKKEREMITLEVRQNFEERVTVAIDILERGRYSLLFRR
jgi:hypothetical protein